MYHTERLTLQLSDPLLAARVLAFNQRNEDFLRNTEPKREKTYFTEEFQRRSLARDLRNARELSAVRLWLLPRGEEAAGDIIGMVGLGSIIFGAFQSAFLSYKIDGQKTGQGLMQEALAKVIEIAFEDIGLHRLEANIMPHNVPSMRLVQKLGFQKEGLAKQYLNINGKWEDHEHMTLLKEEE